MEKFEFANNAVAVLTSVFTSVMGVAYPLIISAVEGLDNKYGSPRMSSLFKKEKCFSNYQNLLWISLLIGISSLYVLQMTDGHDLITNLFVGGYSIVTLGLVYNMLKVVHMVMDYYDPLRLIDRITFHINKQKDDYNEREEKTDVA